MEKTYARHQPGLVVRQPFIRIPPSELPLGVKPNSATSQISGCFTSFCGGRPAYLPGENTKGARARHFGSPAPRPKIAGTGGVSPGPGLGSQGLRRRHQGLCGSRGPPAGARGLRADYARNVPSSEGRGELQPLFDSD